MSRLTKKKQELYVFDRNIEYPTFEDGMVLLQVVGRLEDLEEEIGCPLEVLFRALGNGVYYEDAANHMRFMVVDLHIYLDGEYVLYFDDEEYVLTKNYKKTWWLRKDKSE